MYPSRKEIAHAMGTVGEQMFNSFERAIHEVKKMFTYQLEQMKEELDRVEREREQLRKEIEKLKKELEQFKMQKQNASLHQDVSFI